MITRAIICTPLQYHFFIPFNQYQYWLFLIYVPLSLSVSLSFSSMSLSLSPSLSLSLTLYIYLSLPISLTNSLSIYLSFSFSHSLYLSFFSLSLRRELLSSFLGKDLRPLTSTLHVLKLLSTYSKVHTFNYYTMHHSHTNIKPLHCKSDHLHHCKCRKTFPYFYFSHIKNSLLYVCTIISILINLDFFLFFLSFIFYFFIYFYFYFFQASITVWRKKTKKLNSLLLVSNTLNRSQVRYSISMTIIQMILYDII